MTPFYSKRNQVFPVLWQGNKAAEKHFLHKADWEREVAVYRAMSLPCPELLYVGEKTLVTAYCPYPTLLDELERQERLGFSPRPWESLAAWLRQCEAQVQLLPDEGNLRNFLWDEEHGTVLGLDFEGYDAVSLQHSGGKIIAALLEYTPTGTQVKQQAAGLLEKLLQVSPEQTEHWRHALREMRRARAASLL